MILNLEKLGFGKNELAVNICDAKYGSGHRGVFASQSFKQGEVVFKCDESTCDYAEDDNIDLLKTKDELIECCNDFPECKDFLINYNHMADYDTYVLPKNWKDQKLECTCAYFNHSCEPNCVFVENDKLVSLRNISAGEELTFDYQTLDTEGSFDYGLNCKCGSKSCCGILLFNRYRNDEWLSVFEKYCSPHVKYHINNLKTKWFSADCYVKRYNSSQKGLTALKSIAKDTLVATFCNSVLPESHYLRSSSNPSCYLVDNRVFTSTEIRTGEELTLDYTSVTPNV